MTSLQPQSAGNADRDDTYRQLLLAPLRTSAEYTPKMGQARSVSLADFEELYRADPFYSWWGLDSPLVYAAHRAGGGITSIYRQIGIGCERLWRQLIRDQTGITEEQSTWSYRTPIADGRQRVLRLDGRIDQRHVEDSATRARVEEWLRRARDNREITTRVEGVVFEVRQGYKSKDSKRQNADIDNASHAVKNAYVPAVTILSLQMDMDLQRRYRENNWVVLTGLVGTDDDMTSCYAFSKNVLGYDLAAFFMRNSEAMKREVHEIISRLLRPGLT